MCSRDPILVDATLNCLAILIRSRPAVANKILAAVLSFNPFRAASTTMTPRLHVIYRSMERTTFALLKYVAKSMPNHPMADKIHAYMMRLQQQRTQFFAGPVGVKRPAEPSDGLDDAKRQRLSAPPKFPAMPPPPNTVAQLFTLTEDTMLHQFDVKLIQDSEMISNVVFLLMQMLEPGKLEPAIDAIRARYDRLKKVSQPTPVPDVPMAGPTGIDDDDDYEPDFSFANDAAVVPTNEKPVEELMQPAIDLGPFELPKPPPLTDTEVATLSEQTVRHVFSLVVGLEPLASSMTRPQMGFSRLAAAANDRDAWVTILARLATRTPTTIDAYELSARKTDEDADSIVKADPLSGGSTAIANRIREALFLYILDDFRPRLPIAISWLSEEWYADKVTANAAVRSAVSKDSEADGEKSDVAQTLPNYSYWCTRLLDRLVPYLDARDKNLLIRFVSEVPSINRQVLGSVKTLARDPERVSMCVLSMQYLLMFRPPSRQLVLETLREVWDEGDAQVRQMTGKVLTKWLPGWDQEEKEKVGDVKGANGDFVVRSSVDANDGLQQAQPTPKSEGEDVATVAAVPDAARED
jgi:symplekin